MNRTAFKSKEGKALIRGFCEKTIRNWPVKHERLNVSASGYKTHIIVSGPADGEAVILLHGTGTNSASWMGDVPGLSEEFRVYAVDIPGEPGLSDEQRLSMAEGDPPGWLEGLFESLGLEKAHLIGMSLGGCFSLMFGAAHPEKVSSMTLLAPPGLAAARLSFHFKALPLMFLGDLGL